VPFDPDKLGDIRIALNDLIATEGSSAQKVIDLTNDDLKAAGSKKPLNLSVATLNRFRKDEKGFTKIAELRSIVRALEKDPVYAKYFKHISEPRGPVVPPTTDSGNLTSPSTRVFSRDDLIRELQNGAWHGQIQIDAFAYTAETLLQVFESFLQSLHNSPHDLKTISIRLLVRDFDRPCNIPRDAQHGANTAYIAELSAAHRYFLGRFAGQMRHHSEALKVDIALVTRMYEIEPFHKGIIVNSRTAYWGLYGIEKGLREGFSNVWDYDGHSVRFCEFRRDGGSSGAEMIRSLMGWFNQIWENFSRPAEYDSKSAGEITQRKPLV
jgi:hypothetical protein